MFMNIVIVMYPRFLDRNTIHEYSQTVYISESHLDVVYRLGDQLWSTKKVLWVISTTIELI